MIANKHSRTEDGFKCSTAVGLVVHTMLGPLLAEVGAIAGPQKYDEVVSWLAMQTEVRGPLNRIVAIGSTDTGSAACYRQPQLVGRALDHMLPQLFVLSASPNAHKKRLGLLGLHHLVMEANGAELNIHCEMLTEVRAPAPIICFCDSGRSLSWFDAVFVRELNVVRAQALLRAIVFWEIEFLSLSAPAACRALTLIHRLHGQPNSAAGRAALEGCHKLMHELLRALGMVDHHEQRQVEF